MQMFGRRRVNGDHGALQLPRHRQRDLALLRFQTGENFTGSCTTSRLQRGRAEDYEDYQATTRAGRRAEPAENAEFLKVTCGFNGKYEGHGTDDPDATPCEPLQGCG